MKNKFTKSDVLTIPNFISFFRLLLIPFIIWTYIGLQNYVAALVLIAVSAVSDIADGFIARKFNMISDFGKALDPVADKFTQAAMMICLISRYAWMWALLILLIIKEFLMLVWGCMVVKATEKVDGAKWYGKVSTVVLYGVMMALVIFTEIPPEAANIMIASCAVFMLVSLILYGKNYISVLKNDKKNPLNT